MLLDYSLTKGGIHAFTRALATNLISRGVRVNAVAPGPVWTPLNPSDQRPQDIRQFGAKAPMKRPAQPEEIAPAYVFFCLGAMLQLHYRRNPPRYWRLQWRLERLPIERIE